MRVEFRSAWAHDQRGGLAARAPNKEGVVAVWKRNGDSGPVATPEKKTAPAEPPSKFLADSATMRTSLGADAQVTGKLSFNAPTRIDGKLNGEVSCSDLLVIGETGTVDGNVRATELVVLGTILGDIRGAQRIEIGPRGRIEGTIETYALAVREGGKLNGACRVMPPKADIHVLATHRPTPEVDE